MQQQEDIMQKTQNNLNAKEENVMQNKREQKLAYKKLYYLKNKEKILIGQKKYYLKNKEKRKQYSKEWRLKNINKLKIQKKEWYLNNKEHKKKYDIIYKNKHKERYKKQNKKYQKENRDKINKFLLNKYHNNIHFKLSNILRKRVIKVLKGYNKSKNTMNLLGCTIEELWKHLEYTFKPGMTRENHGLWHVDHIKPCASFDLTKPEEQAKCFHYTNLQALWAHENLSKSDKIL
jgi:hypothetical protein